MISTATKYCTKCKQTKPVSEFHRLGANNYQRHCKQCRNAAAKQAPTSPRIQKSISAIAIQQNGERIISLENRLRLIAARYGRDNMQTDDIYGYIVEQLLTRIQPGDDDGRILTMAKSRARDYIIREEHYTYYADVEDSIATSPEEDCDVFERFISQAVNPEDELVLREMSAQIAEAIANLSPENQQIVYMLADGVRPAEIARRMGISKPAVLFRMQTIHIQSVNLA